MKIFSSILSAHRMSNSESEVIFLKEFAEKEIEALEVKIQNLSVQSSFQLSFEVRIENFQLSFEVRIENKDESDKSKFRKWHDPISNYIKEVFDSRFQYPLYDKLQTDDDYKQMMIVVPVFILLMHRSRFSLSIQILVWLHWKHDFT